MKIGKNIFVRVFPQKHYILMGGEWDFDIDANEINIHVWPLSIEVIINKIGLDTKWPS